MGDERLGGGVHGVNVVGTIERLGWIRTSFAPLGHAPLLPVRSQHCHTHKTWVPTAL
ncbi:hypothetical protein GCM10010466_52210 [Planomonospora alba]|uniref:Uncharacterized protein n=1 Tax=Planomonospora alba TaxID=161354 RepID=A0ABP6NPB9_9ACTN